MALVQLFLRKKPIFWPGGLSVPTPPPIEVDASIREVHETRFQWTGAPIENGQFATDHGIELPTSLVMDVVFTRTPAELIPNVQATRHLRLYDQLVRLAQLRTPLDVSTSLKLYTSMVFDSITTIRTRETTNALTVSCRLHKIEIATVDAAQDLADAALDMALAADDLGAIVSAGAAV